MNITQLALLTIGVFALLAIGYMLLSGPNASKDAASLRRSP